LAANGDRHRVHYNITDAHKRRTNSIAQLCALALGFVKFRLKAAKYGRDFESRGCR
jgi:hypothetical protein